MRQAGVTLMFVLKVPDVCVLCHLGPLIFICHRINFHLFKQQEWL